MAEKAAPGEGQRKALEELMSKEIELDVTNRARTVKGSPLQFKRI